MMHISNPSVEAIDLLSKLSHDDDAELSRRAILGLGLIGVGTNHSRYLFYKLESWEF